MGVDKYEVLAGGNHRVYEFLSQGARGTIKKVIVYQKMSGFDNTFNLAFGDWDEQNQKINDQSRTNNNDRDKVLATVASTISDFIEYNPGSSIFVRGSTAARTRLYEIGIASHLEMINKDFDIYGLYKGDWELFERGKHYDAFLLTAQ